MICGLILGVLALACVLALFALVVGIFGLFGAERDPLAAKNMTRETAAIVLSGVILAGCGTPGERTTGQPAVQTTAPRAEPGASEAAASRPLAGTSWRLVEFQSMDDAIGTVKPTDPSLYTMQLNADGTVAMRLNCNRATGSWAAEPSADPSNGRFQFGSLAATRALCPPPSMDERIAAHAEFVRSYLLKDGRLYLSLMADGGIYAWEPLPTSASAGPPTEPSRGDAATGGAEAMPKTVLEIIKKEYASADLPPTRYLAGTADLNGDGRPELLVHVVGPMPCGTGGCPTLVFTPNDAGYALVSTITLTRPPIRVSPRSSSGWRHLIVEIGGGGGRSGHAELAYSGKGYPENPTVPPARRITDLNGTETVIAEFESFEAATPLPPN